MLDAVFVAEFIEGRRIFRHVEADGAVTSVHVGDSVPLDETLCARIADGRLDALLPDLPAVQRRRQLPPLPITIGSYIGVPLRLRDGRLFGMLCGFTCEVSAFLDERDVDRMQVAADLIAGLFDADH